jgi:hypothetical protein
MKYTFLLSILILLTTACALTPIEREKDQGRQLCKDITDFIYDNDYKAEKCALLDFIKKEVNENFNVKTYYASVELVKGIPVSPVPCPEKIMREKDEALKGRFKPLSDRTINEKNNILYYVEHDEKVKSTERKIRVKIVDRGERYVINVEILTE